MVRSSRLAHDGSTLLPWLSGPGSSRTPITLGWCLHLRGRSSVVRTAAGRTVPDRRRAAPGRAAPAGTPTAARRGSRHSGTGCSQAPRPGSRRRGSGVSTPSTATTRSRSPAGARVRQPTQVRTGPWSVGGRTGTAGRRARVAARASDRTRVYRVTAQRDSVPGVRAAPAGALADVGGVRRPCLARGTPVDARVGVAADVDAPAGEPRREPGVLALLADGEGELEVRHDHPGGPGPRVEHRRPTPPSTATARCRRTSRGRPTSR